MTLILIKVILNLVSMLLILVFFLHWTYVSRRIKGRKVHKQYIVGLHTGSFEYDASIYTNLQDKRIGIRCFSCDELTEKGKTFDYLSLPASYKDDFRLCKCCERQLKLDSILHKYSLLLRFKKFVLSSRYDKYSPFYVLLVFPITVLGYFFDRHGCMPSIITSCMLISHWICMIYRNYLIGKINKDCY